MSIGSFTLCVCACECACVCHGMPVERRGKLAGILLFFVHVGSRVIRLSSKCLYLLSHAATPSYILKSDHFSFLGSLTFWYCDRKSPECKAALLCANIAQLTHQVSWFSVSGRERSPLKDILTSETALDFQKFKLLETDQRALHHLLAVGHHLCESSHKSIKIQSWWNFRDHLISSYSSEVRTEDQGLAHSCRTSQRSVLFLCHRSWNKALQSCETQGFSTPHFVNNALATRLLLPRRREMPWLIS